MGVFTLEVAEEVKVLGIALLCAFLFLALREVGSPMSVALDLRREVRNIGSGEVVFHLAGFLVLLATDEAELMVEESHFLSVIKAVPSVSRELDDELILALTEEADQSRRFGSLTEDGLAAFARGFLFEDDDDVIADVCKVWVGLPDKSLNVFLDGIACFPSIHFVSPLER
jgi:hypothetical protein